MTDLLPNKVTCNILWDFLHSSVSKASACNAGDLDSIPGLGRSPEKGNGNPLQYSLAGEFQGQRSLEDYSPWDHKKSDMTYQLNTATIHRNALNSLSGDV